MMDDERHRTVRDPVRFARNAALLSGIPAAVTIVLGISEGSVALTVLPSIALFFAVCGVVMWARQERNRQD